MVPPHLRARALGVPAAGVVNALPRALLRAHDVAVVGAPQKRLAGREGEARGCKVAASAEHDNPEERWRNFAPCSSDSYNSTERPF